jgi:hypothetical protein
MTPEEEAQHWAKVDQAMAGIRDTVDTQAAKIAAHRANGVKDEFILASLVASLMDHPEFDRARLVLMVCHLITESPKSQPPQER